PAVITIRLGTGDGKFSKGQSITLDNGGSTLIAGDWNNDGILDLAATESSGLLGKFVTILLGNGDGTFAVTGSFNSGGGLTQMVTGDFNGDGVADLVIGFGLNASVLLGLGGGQFGSPQALPEYYNALFGLAVADFNLDGKLDLAALTDDDFDG